MPGRRHIQGLLAAAASVTGVFLLAACQGYDFRVNERVIYSPAPLFTKFDIPDAALQACVKQAIVDGSIRAPEQLTALNCSHAGIEDLSGLATFVELTHIRLSSNRIRNLVELGALRELRALYLDDNRIVDPVPLYTLSALERVDLSGNANLQCPRDDGFDRVNSVALPEHCR